jgi:hypothetical protein
MHPKTRLVGAVLLSLGAFVSLQAQSTTQPTPDGKTMTDALKLRGDMGDAVAKGSEKPDAAITRLRAQASPTGLKIDHDADFAFAAIDVGQRLLAADKPAEAGQFFREAEISLTAVLGRTPDTKVQDKTQFLAQRAFIRAKFLSEPVLAKADLDAAQLLKPDDSYLQTLRSELTKDKAAFFTTTPKG